MKLEENMKKFDMRRNHAHQRKKTPTWPLVIITSTAKDEVSMNYITRFFLFLHIHLRPFYKSRSRKRNQYIVYDRFRRKLGTSERKNQIDPTKNFSDAWQKSKMIEKWKNLHGERTNSLPEISEQKRRAKKYEEKYPQANE